MSYDYEIINWQGEQPARRADGEFLTQPLGSAAEVRAKVKEVWRRADWNDPTYGTYNYFDTLIEMPLKKENDQTIVSLTLFTHHSVALHAILKLCKKWKWAVYDLQSGEVLTVKDMRKSLKPTYEETRQILLKEHFQGTDNNSTAPAQLCNDVAAWLQQLAENVNQRDLAFAEYFDDEAEVFFRTSHSFRRRSGAEYKNEVRSLFANATSATSWSHFSFSDVEVTNSGKEVISVQALLYDKTTQLLRRVSIEVAQGGAMGWVVKMWSADIAYYAP